MKRARKILLTTVPFYGVFTLTGCGNAVSDTSSKVTDTSSNDIIIESNVQSTGGSSEESNSETAENDSDSILFDGFRVSIDTERTMNTYIIENQFSELNGRKVYAVPMTVENIGDETKGINMFYVKSFGSHGTELDSVYAYFTEAQDFYKELRPGAKKQTAFYMLDDGSGEYCIVFKNFTEEKELFVNIA